MFSFFKKQPVKYPNFLNAIKSIYHDSVTLYNNDRGALCYKVPFKTYQKSMGDMYFSLIDRSNMGNKPYILQVYRGLDGVEIVTNNKIMPSDSDLTVDEYVRIFNDLGKEIMSDERYLISMTQGF